MPKMIQVRNVPDDVHRTLKIRAAEAGMSLSDYIKRDLERAAANRSWDEIEKRRKARGPSGLTSQDILDALHEGRKE